MSLLTRIMAPDPRIDSLPPTRMTHVVRALAFFVLALFLADLVCSSALNAGRAAFSAGLESGLWWMAGQPVVETFDLTVYAVLFFLSGAAFAYVFKGGIPSTVLALLFGCTYAALHFAVEPDLPFVRYSHAPAWLRVLSWSKFYMPPLASVLGVVVFNGFTVDAARTRCVSDSSPTRMDGSNP